jgi:hypothetical protein
MAFLGLRGTGDWAVDERPKNWREQILYLYPNGRAPLTAILSMLKSESTDDPEFNWWTKTLASRRLTITGVYTDSALLNAYVSGAVKSDVLYLKGAQAEVGEFVEGKQVLIRHDTNATLDTSGKVIQVAKAGASSFIGVRLLEADDNGVGVDLSDANAALIVGNINPEGGPMPSALNYDPVKWSNYTQIFRNSLSLTRTAMKNKLRTKNGYQEAKREALEYHSIDMEQAFIWGIPTEEIGANGKPERTTMGMINAIKTGAPTNVFNYPTDETYDGDTWLTSGEEWLDSKLEVVFRYGGTQKWAFVGSGALLGINRLAKQGGQINLQPTSRVYGMAVMEWITPFGSIMMKTHPLFSFEATTRNTMVVFEPENLIYRYVDDTHFIPDDGRNGGSRIDGKNEEYLAECGLEYHHPLTFGLFTGVGLDNPA